MQNQHCIKFVVKSNINPKIESEIDKIGGL
jgi:hypothetical protein